MYIYIYTYINTYTLWNRRTKTLTRPLEEAESRGLRSFRCQPRELRRSQGRGGRIDLWRFVNGYLVRAPPLFSVPSTLCTAAAAEAHAQRRTCGRLLLPLMRSHVRRARLRSERTRRRRATSRRWSCLLSAQN